MYPFWEATFSAPAKPLLAKGSLSTPFSASSLTDWICYFIFWKFCVTVQTVIQPIFTSNLTPIRWAFSFLYSSSTSKSISFSFLTLASRSSRSASTFDFSNSYCFSAFAWPTERQNSSTSLSTINQIRKQYDTVYPNYNIYK